MGRIVILLAYIITFLLFSCKTGFTHIGGKNANYIPYYIKVYEADSLFLSENYRGSYKILDSLFKKYEPINLPEYNEYTTYIACSYILKEKNLSKKIKKGYSKFNNLGLWHKNYKVIYKGLDSILNNNEVLSAKNKYSENIDFKLRNKIISMIHNDQESRKNKDFKKMELLTINHEKSLDSIFKIHGFPIKEKIGFGLNGESIHFNILLLHLNPSKRNSLISFLKENVINGKYSPDEFATVVDREYLEKSNEMYYGQYQNEGLGYVKDAINVNQRRKIIGLPTLEYEAFRRKYILDIMNNKY